MKKSKKFDCVEMKEKGAEEVQRSLSGKTATEQLVYWQQRTEELQRHKSNLLKSEKIES